MTSGNSNTVAYKHCSRCGTVKAIDAFRVVKRKRGDYPYGFCRACEVETQRKHRAERKFQNSLEAMIEAVGTPPCDTCFRRDRCAKVPVPCWRFDAYVEGGQITVDQSTKSDSTGVVDASISRSVGAAR